MAATSKTLSILILFIIISTIPKYSSQSNSQNIQTFYPSSTVLPPPPPLLPRVNDPPIVSPPTTLQPPSRSSSSIKRAVGTAVGVMAASALVLSGFAFFLLLRHSRRKRERNIVTTTTTTTTNNTTTDGGNENNHLGHPQIENFTRVNGNIKGLIVDENGLDVLYWNKLEEGDINKSSFKKQYYKNLRDEEKDKEEEKRMVSEKSKRYKPPVHEVPLLRGKSSSSQSPMWGETEEKVFKKEPTTLSSGISFKVAEKQNSSIQLMKISGSAPPLPPPPGAPRQPLLVSEAVPKGKMPASPPPPPPPSLAVGAVPKGKTMTAPPPPPPPSLAIGAVSKGKTTTKPPPPPPVRPTMNTAPPPPPTSKRASSLGEETSSKGSGQVKFKPLHWDKVSPNVEHSMVWDKLDKGSFKFDGDLMEALFGTVATNKKSPQRDSRSASPRASDKSGPPSQIFILDTRKSQNTSIILKSIGVPRARIINALVEGRGLNEDTIEKLTRIAPTDEEVSEILAFDGDPTKLADAESFLYHLLKAVPTAFARFDMMLFRANYASEVSRLKECLKSIESACNELRTRGLFLKLLEAVLKAGNRLNAGTSRGNAQAFDLTALRKLSDVKSSDGKTTLLLFVVQEVVRAEGKRCMLNKNQSLSRTSSQSGNSTSDNMTISKDDREREYMMLGLPVIGGLSADFLNVKRAALLDYNLLIKTISDLSEQTVEIRKILAKRGLDGGFAREMKGFLEAAEVEIKDTKEEQTRVMALVKKTLDYYQGGMSKDKGENPLQLFVIVRDFLGMVDQACIDIARNVQKRKPPSTAPSSAVAGSLSPESPRIFRFPKLPANFMSDGSSSDSDNESDVR